MQRADSTTKNVMMLVMAYGVSETNSASRSDETMPLPYCSEPKSAAADPVIVGDTAFRAAALVQEAMIPFVLNMKNMGITIPHRPPMLVTENTVRITTDMTATTRERRSKVSMA